MIVLLFHPWSTFRQNYLGKKLMYMLYVRTDPLLCISKCYHQAYRHLYCILSVFNSIYIFLSENEQRTNKWMKWFKYLSFKYTALIFFLQIDLTQIMRGVNV